MCGQGAQEQCVGAADLSRSDPRVTEMSMRPCCSLGRPLGVSRHDPLDGLVRCFSAVRSRAPPTRQTFGEPPCVFL